MLERQRDDRATRRRMDGHALDADGTQRLQVDPEAMQLRLRLNAEKFSANFVMRPDKTLQHHRFVSCRRQVASDGRAGRTAADNSRFDLLDPLHRSRPMAKRNRNQCNCTASRAIAASAKRANHSSRVSERATEIRPS